MAKKSTRKTTTKKVTKKMASPSKKSVAKKKTVAVKKKAAPNKTVVSKKKSAPKAKSPATKRGSTTPKITKVKPDTKKRKSKRANITDNVETENIEVSLDTPELKEKLRELVKLAKEQDYLTYEDINEILPDDVFEPDIIDVLLSRLRAMEFDIIDASEVTITSARPKGIQTSSKRKSPAPRQRINPIKNWSRSMTRFACI